MHLAKLYLEEQHRGRKVIEDGSVAWNRSVVNEIVSKFSSSTEVQDEDAAIAAVIDGAELKWEERPSNRGQPVGLQDDIMAKNRWEGRHLHQAMCCGQPASSAQLAALGGLDFQALAASGQIRSQSLAALQNELLRRPTASLVLPSRTSHLYDLLQSKEIIPIEKKK